LLERDSLAARIEMESLVASPSLWSSIEESFQRLRRRYFYAYLAYHTSYQQEALEMGHRMEALDPQVKALARFHQIPELGDPVGAGVPQLFTEVAASFRECSIEAKELSLEDMPRCKSCLLSLDEEVPRRDAEALFGAATRAMREYNRRLGSRGVRQVLAHPTREQIDKFLNLVQVADPSALANVLDDEVVQFLRSFLQTRPTDAP
jgi:hypothetical protein